MELLVYCKIGSCRGWPPKEPLLSILAAQQLLPTSRYVWTGIRTQSSYGSCSFRAKSYDSPSKDFVGIVCMTVTLLHWVSHLGDSASGVAGNITMSTTCINTTLKFKWRNAWQHQSTKLSEKCNFVINRTWRSKDKTSWCSRYHVHNARARTII